jgi:hypothetical protein
MKPLLLSLCLIGFLAGPAFSQLRPKDSTYYAQLKTGQTLFSTYVRVHYTAAAEKYLTLDQDRTIPMEEVDRFYSPRGLFVTVPGSAGTDIYRQELDGPKISLFSRVTYDPNASTYDPATHTESYGSYSRKEFFRKPGQVQMHPITYASLTKALSDNPASLQQLRIAKTKVYTGLALFAASLIVEGIGVYETAKRNERHFVYTTSTQYPYYTTSATAVSRGGVSPLLFIGAGGIVTGLVLSLGAHHNEVKALNLYNGAL